jgi:hypothetical protein
MLTPEVEELKTEGKGRLEKAEGAWSWRDTGAGALFSQGHDCEEDLVTGDVTFRFSGDCIGGSCGGSVDAEQNLFDHGVGMPESDSCVIPTGQIFEIQAGGKDN